jgi:DNA-binding CsgD family transcriptional regulator
LDTAERYRLDFAAPYARISAAIAHAGLRQFGHALRSLDEAGGVAQGSRDTYAQQLVYAVRIRTLAESGEHRAALLHPVPELRSAQPAIRAEVLGSRALVLASVGRISEAAELAAQIVGTSQAVELAVLYPAVGAISSLKTGDASAIERTCEVEEKAFSTGALDLLVTAYRMAPELLAALLRLSPQPGRVADLVRRVGDDDLASATGIPLTVVDDPIARLSQRERDVYDLVCQGIPNRRIGELLFISEGTVKAHVHHIYDKLGVRSRTALAVQAALRRSNQATSATSGSDADGAS